MDTDKNDYVTTITCGECEEKSVVACSIAMAERLILTGWRSKRNYLVCPECAKGRSDLDGEAHTEGLLVMKMYFGRW